MYHHLRPGSRQPGLLVFSGESGLKVFIHHQGLGQDLETGCLKLAIVKSLGIQIYKGDHNILGFQP